MNQVNVKHKQGHNLLLLSRLTFLVNEALQYGMKLDMDKLFSIMNIIMQFMLSHDGPDGDSFDNIREPKVNFVDIIVGLLSESEDITVLYQQNR